jgi:N-acetylneuraminate synthase
MAKEIKLTTDGGERDIIIGPGREPQVIAEAGVLTWGDKGRGFLFVDEAVKAGIKFLKFQAFSADNVVGKEYDWYERLKQRELKKETFLEIMEYGRIRGVTVFASTHNEYDIIELSNAGMPILKLGAGDSNNERMIDMCLTTGKPIVLSIGLLRRDEIFRLLDKYKNYGDRLIVLWCRTVYPTPPEAAGLGFIKELVERYPELNFGYSDHTAGDAVTLAATTISGVALIEKHFCLQSDRISPKYLTWDTNGALTADEMREFLKKVRDVHAAMKGGEEYDDWMIKNRSWAQKAVVARRDIPAGKLVEADDLMSLRPHDEAKGHISISEFYSLLAKPARRDVKKGEYLRRGDI